MSPEILETIIEREFEAPLEKVFAAFTIPEKIEQWYGPQGFNTKVEEFDLNIGGKWKFVMKAPNGSQFPIMGKFSEIQSPNKLVMTDGWDEENKRPVGPTLEYNFEKITENKTKMKMVIIHKAQADKDKYEGSGAMGGWDSSYERLKNCL